MNAAHATEGGGTVTMEVQPLYLTDSEARRHPSLHEGRHVGMVVRDTGVGIPPEVRDRVFEPFFTTKEPGGGSGLGLAIVHRVVVEHQGALELESVVGTGTTVRVIFPAIQSDEPEPDRQVPRRNGEHILYGDDEPRLAEVGRRRLEALGHVVSVSEDGESAFELFQDAPAAFDILVTDYLMPRMNGLELARAITAVRPAMPIILLTGYVEHLPEGEIAAAGVQRTVSKPVTLDELGIRVRELLDPRDSAP